jgi:hypothetical protein
MILRMMHGKVFIINQGEEIYSYDKTHITISNTIEFCSSSSVDDNEDITSEPAQVFQPVIENVKPLVAIDLFGDLDPRAMFNRL